MNGKCGKGLRNGFSSAHNKNMCVYTRHPLTLCTLFSLIFFFFSSFLDFHFFNSIAFFSWHSNLLLLKLLSLFQKGILKRDWKKVLNGSKQQQREEFFFFFSLEFQKLFNNTTHQSFSSILLYFFGWSLHVDY